MDTQGKLLTAELSKIKFDSNNPRGESEEQILEDKSFSQLKESIREHGVLEPLKVRQEEEYYILIDGERRLRALKDLKRTTTPILVNNKNKDSRILAYQIHMNRKPWSKPAEIKSIKGIIQEIRTENPNISDVELKKELMSFTNHKAAAISDFMYLANYKDEIFDEINSNPKGKLGHSYLVQIESSFINPLKRLYPDIVSKFGENGIRDIMVDKVRKGLMATTRYLMDTFKKVFQDTTHKKQIERILVDFLTAKGQGIRSAYSNYEQFLREKEKSEKSKISNTSSKPSSSSELDKPKETSPKSTSSSTPKGTAVVIPVPNSNNNEVQDNHKDLTPAQKQPLTFEDIKKKYEKIGKTFSLNESKYLEEALFCLETGRCYKAATLMLWASAISRILLHISKNIPLFNTTCESMKKNPKSFYTHYCRNFQVSATDITDIREATKDMQLICYICYMQYVDDHELKKLKGHYDSRNDCAHPTGVEIGANEAFTMFENIYNLILNNPKLK